MKGSDKLISIIIPIYNAEKHLRKCLNSILAQTHKNWEAILVNDGSSDNSGIICDEYAAKDQRFKVIHQLNGGVSAARQTGLNNISGDYTIHCDPDDWIDTGMLEAMLKKAVEESADMVICDIIEEKGNVSNYYSQYFSQNCSAKDIQSLIINNQVFGSCWNKLIKTTYVKDISFAPTEISYCEDTLFNIKVLMHDIKVVHIPVAFYHYNHTNESSICHSTNAKIILSRCLAISEIEKIISDKNPMNMYTMKRSVLDALFISKNFKELNNTYCDIHQTIINNHKRYHFFTPLGYFLSMALKGYPHIAYHLYTLNLNIINWSKKIKSKFHNCKK